MAKRKLSELQIAAIELLAKPKRNGLTYKQVAEEVGVDESTLHRWRNEDYFNDAVNRKVVRSMSDRFPEVADSIADHVIKDGNAAMLRTMMQAMGLLTEKVEIDSKGSGVDMDAMKAEVAKYRERQRLADDE